MIQVGYDAPDYIKKGENFRLAILNEEAMLRVGFEQVLRIKDRTARGLDSDEQPFKPYSQMWAAVRREKGAPIDHVDLFFTGKMMAAMDFAVTAPGVVRIFFLDPEQSAKAHKHNTGTDGVPERKFFDISDEDARLIAESIQEEAVRLFT